jgi:predicted kinase
MGSWNHRFETRKDGESDQDLSLLLEGLQQDEDLSALSRSVSKLRKINLIELL